MKSSGFFDFLRKLDRGALPRPVTVLYGFNEFLGEWVIRSFCRHFLESRTDFNFRRFYFERGGDAGWEDVLAEAASSSFFLQSRKVVVATIRESRQISLNKQDRDLLQEYLKKDSHHSLLIIYVSLDLSPDEFKQLRKGRLNTLLKNLESPNCESVDLDRIRDAEISSYLKENLADQKIVITPGALERLREILGNQYVSAINLLPQLSAWARGEKKIDQQDVDVLVSGIDSHSIWDLADAIEHEDADSYLRILRYLFLDGVKPAYIIGTMVTYYQKIFSARLLMENHYSVAEIGRLMQQPSFFLDKFIRSVRGFSAAKLRQILSIIYSLDYDSKTGGEEVSRLALQNFIFRVKLLRKND